MPHGRLRTLRVLALLLSAGVDIDARNIEGTTPLIYAARMGYDKACCFLVEQGADVTIKDLDGEDAAYKAEINGYNDLAEYLRLTESLH